MTKIFLDANVLYSTTIRSLFIWLNANDTVKIFWSMETWDEVFTAYSTHHEASESNRFRSSMTEVIATYPDCLTRATPLSTPMGLKDQKDEHVIAAAFECGASYVVTNDKPLLNEDLSKVDLVAIEPDDLLMTLAKNTPLDVIEGVHAHIASLRKSQPSIASYLQSLRNAGLVTFAAWLERRRKAKKLFAEVWNR